ncbi:FAD/NAD(P)-binding protein [Kutzneria buriramensis]|uniref:FAD/NAD(P)-binding protein n=1 Tax=Kutzneria buriramensis TaxID=1045776 RepID=UPI00147683E4|nr:FAD/NAD(P)-binding protein [Kutzneria buriramensis]
MGPVTRVAVVGMGATGVLTYVHLVDHLLTAGVGAGTEIHLVERSSQVGAGVAYGTQSDDHLLNMQAGTMSVFPDRPNDFVDWLGGKRDAAAYIPRHRFGEYLRARLSEAMSRADAAGISTEVVRCEVRDCYFDDNEVRLVATAPLPPYDYAVLCVGDLPPTTYQELRPHPRYVHDPWRAGAAMPPVGARVGVLGSSLTAVDVLLSLRSSGHEGPVTCFTRSRGLPRVQPAVLRPHRLRHVTEENLLRLTDDAGRKLGLAEVAGLLRSELGSLVDWRRATGPRQGDPIALLRSDIDDAVHGRAGWYDVLDSTSELTPLVWHHMTDAAKTAFLRRLHSGWSGWRHPIPLVNARRIADLAERGQLRVRPRVRSVAPNADGGFDIAHQVGDRVGTTTVDHLVNATGTGFNPWLVDSPLVRAMTHAGRLRAHPLGGVDVDFATLRVRDAAGGLAARVFFVGPLTRGVHFYTNSVETNLVNARALTGQLAAAMTKRVPALSA